MITIIHGTDTATSRKYLMDEKEKFADSTLIDGQKVNLTDLAQIFEGGELFTENKNFFIEQLLTKKKGPELKQIVDYIKTTDKNNIFLWEDRELTKATLNSFKNPTIKAFKLPQTLFLFLENIKPGNGKILIKLFHETIQTSDPEMVFFMITRQIRSLFALSEARPEGSNTIDEIKRLAPWQKSKLQSQADFFEIGELKKLYSKLFEIEIGLKTGGLSASLVPTIDFLLLDI